MPCLFGWGNSFVGGLSSILIGGLCVRVFTDCDTYSPCKGIADWF